MKGKEKNVQKTKLKMFEKRRSQMEFDKKINRKLNRNCLKREDGYKRKEKKLNRKKMKMFEKRRWKQNETRKMNRKLN